jgi:hypothetical protein
MAKVAISPDVKKIALLIELSSLVLNPLSTRCLKTVPTPSNERATVNNEQNTITKLNL